MHDGPADSQVALRYVVSGRVQRVRFRAATRRRARVLSLRGWARNLDDGRVEVLACGRRDDVEALARWLRRGPTFARVDALEQHPASPPDGDGFHVL